MTPAIELDGVTLRYGSRLIWGDLSLRIEPGEFVAILGPNGSGKTSLLKAILGVVAASAGSITVLGHAPRRGDPAIGYVPQHQSFDRDLPLRGRDLVRLGVDGHRWGLPLPSATIDARVRDAVASVGATEWAEAPVGQLSGGEQQRLRIAQALVGRPQLLLCDEPLANLDLRSQRAVVDLVNDWRQTGGTVLFVTHDVNPIVSVVSRVLFVVNGRWAAGGVDEVLTSARLTQLYGSHVDVVRVHDHILVVGEGTGTGFAVDEPHHDLAAAVDHEGTA
jgi:zinc/manganese transport system ATP-binding protein